VASPPVVFNGTTWGNPASIAGTITSTPGCSSDGAGNAICAAFTTVNYSVIVYRYNGTTWSPGLNIGGQASGERPTCTKMGIPGQVACFAEGLNTALFGNRFNGGSWTLANWGGWGSLGGLISSNASCASIGAGQLICGVIGQVDSVLYANQFNSTSWLGWVKIGSTTAFRNPSCASLGAGKALCAIIGTTNKASSTVGP
jgi:hypothetical protein